MADGIVVNVTGTDVVIQNIGAIDGKVKLALAAAMDKLGIGFIDYLRANKLSGSPLRRVTGALQQSFTHRTAVGSTDVSALITTDSPYAAYHEYGFHGLESVRAHTRQGHPVRAFTRTVNYDGRPYVRPALDEYRGIIFTEIDAAVAEATR